MSDLTYALTEEIGDPDLFVGRKAEMARLLDWAEGVKRRISKSTGILSRRKMGKTALLQRFFNILYTRNDPRLIPFYYRIPEEPLRKSVFASFFYRPLLSQYFSFTTRTPKMVEKTLSFDALRELARDDPDVAEDIREIEKASIETIEDDFKSQLDTARRQAAWHKGQAAEPRYECGMFAPGPARRDHDDRRRTQRAGGG